MTAFFKTLLLPTRKLEQAIRRIRRGDAMRWKHLLGFGIYKVLGLNSWHKQALERWQARNLEAYQALDVPSVLSACKSQPLYSLVVPVFRSDLPLLRLCIASVLRQLYTKWELILVDDGSQSPELTAELQTWAARDPRIRIIHLASNQGISAATNCGIRQASGLFVGFLDHDDELTPDALLWMVVAHNANLQSRWFYSDEATLEADGNFAGRIHRKPAFSWEYLLSVMYTCHFSVYDRQLLEDVGGLREDFDGAQDHDLALRLSELVEPDTMTHIPQLLYFWRATEQSTASSLDSKPAASGAAYRAVMEAARRRQLRCRFIADPDCGTRFQVYLQPKTTPKVTILIPAGSATNKVIRCIESLSANTSYSNYEIVVIGGPSDDPALTVYLADLEISKRACRIAYDQQFNHSDIHNRAVAESDCELVLFLDNGVYSFSEGWLEQLVATIELDLRVAGVGAKLLFPDGKIQHAGVAIGVGDSLVKQVERTKPGNSHGYFGRGRALQEVSAVTGAMLLIRKSAFQAVGGFDSERFPASYNDVDLWMRLAAAGYRCLFNPAVQAFCEESKTQSKKNEREYQRRLRENIERCGWRDPFWPPVLFTGPMQLFEHEYSWDWIPEKLANLCLVAEALRASQTTVGSTHRPESSKTRGAGAILTGMVPAPKGGLNKALAQVE